MEMKEVKAITLKNIDLTGISCSDELQKLQEERKEFELAVLEALYERSPENDRHAIEEAFDEMQSILSYLQKTLGITSQEFMDHYCFHEEKIKSRPRKKE